VREVLTAQYYVRRVGPTRYEQVDGEPDVIEFTQPRARAGMLTTGWFAVINTMFTPVPRTTAAQAYRAYLGLDIAKSEGLVEPDAPLVDYDDKGITADGCAGCHRTLDPLAYPFSRYWGIAGGNTGVYDPRRPTRFDAAEGSPFLACELVRHYTTLGTRTTLDLVVDERVGALTPGARRLPAANPPPS
jgi:hypothetical protein